MNSPAETHAPTPRGFDDFMSRMTGSGRAAVERHLAACEKEMAPDHVRLWKRMVGLLGRLTPDALPMSAARAVRFYVPDGKYKLQVFAVEDLRDGKLGIYLDDTRPTAFREGVLTGEPEPDSNLYGIGGGKADEERLSIELLTAAGTTSAPDYYKHMLGWHRTAIRITLGMESSTGQVRAAEAMCMIAAAARPAPAGAGAIAATSSRSRFA
jgi:hypothetical protein